MNLEVRRIEFDQKVGKFIAENHYSKTYSRSVIHCFGLFDSENKFLGACTFSSFSRHQSALRYGRAIELSRLVILPEAPKNTASFFISKCLKWLRLNTQYSSVISYADPTVGHSGAIYKASNFLEIGKTRSSYHYTDSKNSYIHKKNIWQKAVRLSTKEKEYAESIGLVRVEETPKIIFKYVLKPSNPEVHGSIYCIKNKINDKLYVGMTTQALTRRFQRHTYDSTNGSPLPIHSAIRSIGLENFWIEEIDTASTLKELQDKEALWIEKLKSHHTENGYNVNRGYDFESYLIPDKVLMDSFFLRKKGKSLKQISKILSVSPGYIQHIQAGKIRPHLLRRFEEEHGPLARPRVMSEIEKDAIFNLFQSGKSLSEIASELKTSRTYVNHLLNGKIDPERKKKFSHIEVNTSKKKRTEKEIRAIFSDYFINNLSVKEIESKYKIGSIHSFISKERKTERFKAWNGPKKRDYTQIPEEDLLEAFKLKALGIPSAKIADQLGIDKNWINIVLRGEARPEVKARWLRENGSAPKKARPLRSACRVVSTNICFYTPKHAADFLGVTSAAIIKAIKKGTLCKGLPFAYYKSDED
jgi:group I intron endonuclease